MLLVRGSHLRMLSHRCTFYERHEILDAQGQVLERHQRGEPHVHDRKLGRIPVDPELPFLEDGSTVGITTLGYHDAQGRWHRVVRYQRLSCAVRETRSPQLETLRPLTAPARASLLSALLQDQRVRVPVAVLLRDQGPTHRLPPLAMTGLAFTEHHRYDTLTPRRRKLRADDHARRVREAGPLRAWIRSVGGRLGHHSTTFGSVLSAWIPRNHLAALLERPEVVGVEPRRIDSTPEGAGRYYLCHNLPARWDDRRDTDAGDCEPTAHDGVLTPACAYLDALNAATGAQDYIDAGYDGQIDGGNANWGHPPLRPTSSVRTLTLGIRDGNAVEVYHPAFEWYRHSRFLYILHSKKGDDDISADDVKVYNEFDIAGTMEIPLPAPDDNDQAHATRCAAIAMANPTVSSEPKLSTTEAREARSGVARMVSAAAGTGETQIYEMLSILYGGTELGEDEDGNPYEGIDVISSSQKEATGETIAKEDLPEVPWERKGDLRCPTEAEVRGVDIGSLWVVYAYSNAQLIFCKAGGNDHIVSSACDVPYEVSPPGASPAAISSSALDTIWMTAAEIQQADRLHADSSRGLTPDGRSYPTLAVASQTCGVATSMNSDTGDPDGYEKHGQTSATAPRVAGSALILKHWYRTQYGSLANQSGRIIVNLLNFADGFGRIGTSAARADPPSPGWGLGRLRMRLFPDAQTSGSACHGTASYGVRWDSVHDIDITGGTGALPSRVRHLRITAWWIEMNVGLEATVGPPPVVKNEDKANIRLTLVYLDSAGTLHADEVESGREHTLRLQYDRDDPHYACPPQGEVHLLLHASSVPVEKRSRFYPGGPVYDSRVVYVAWFWETTEDPTEINCGTSVTPSWDRCDEPLSDGSTDITSEPATEASEATPTLRATRLAAERAIRDTHHIAMGLAPTAGCGPVFEAHRPLSPCRSTG